MVGANEVYIIPAVKWLVSEPVRSPTRASSQSKLRGPTYNEAITFDLPSPFQVQHLPSVI